MTPIEKLILQNQLPMLGALSVLMRDVNPLQASRLSDRTLATIDALEADAAPSPKGWLHTLHMEGGQKETRLTFSAANAFGKPGRDYSREYTVTSEPLEGVSKPLGALAMHALRLHRKWESLPTDRGGKDGTKGRAWAAFVEVRDKVLGDKHTPCAWPIGACPHPAACKCADALD